ncbi:MAG: RidA family protein [Spirochaetia bacterium]|jgi:2-iminobutanoate/2-iminopropanoate deaminase|nr:RidA family protein [Spirochaetia bacterium]
MSIQEKRLTREIINTDKAPAAIGPYSQAVKAGGFLFTSGILPLDPETGKLVKGGIESETVQIFENLKSICEEAGSSLNRIVSATVYIIRMDDFEKMNKIYSSYFSDNFPSRATVEVGTLAKGACVEIQAVAICGK